MRQREEDRWGEKDTQKELQKERERGHVCMFMCEREKELMVCVCFSLNVIVQAQTKRELYYNKWQKKTDIQGINNKNTKQNKMQAARSKTILKKRCNR